MQKALRNTPTFDTPTFLAHLSEWKDPEQGVAPGHRVIIEWSTGTGPRVFIFPAGRRDLGFQPFTFLQGPYNDERWADFLEFEYVPQIVDALQREGYRPDVICVDLSPLQTQRARRRQIEAAGRAKAGVAAH